MKLLLCGMMMLSISAFANTNMQGDSSMNTQDSMNAPASGDVQKMEERKEVHKTEYGTDSMHADESQMQQPRSNQGTMDSSTTTTTKKVEEKVD